MKPYLLVEFISSHGKHLYINPQYVTAVMEGTDTMTYVYTVDCADDARWEVLGNVESVILKLEKCPTGVAA